MAVVVGAWAASVVAAFSNWIHQTTSFPSGYLMVASSSDGTRLAVAVNGDYIYTSGDSGATWIKQTASGSRIWQSITMSATGQYIYASSGRGSGQGVYLSSDYGTTWALKSSYINGFVRTSSSGQYAIGSADSYYGYSSAGAWISNDYGVTWRQGISTSGLTMNAVATDASGKYMIAAVERAFYTSTDYGATFTAQSIIYSGDTRIQAIVSDASGQYVAVITDVYLYTSSNYGVTNTRAGWFPADSFGHQCFSMASDATGQHLAFTTQGGGGGKIYLSSDYGATLVAQSPTPHTYYWDAIASDSTGTKLIAVTLVNNVDTLS